MFCLVIVETNQLVYVLQKSVAIKTGSSNIYYEFVKILFHATLAERRIFSLISPIYSNRVGQSREIYSNSVPLSPPHWPYPKRIRPPSWPRVAVASSIQNTKLFTWRTWPGAGAVPKCDWAVRGQCGFKQRRADHAKYIWYVATHGQSVINTELMIAWIWWRGWLCIISSVIVWKMTIWFFHTHM